MGKGKATIFVKEGRYSTQGHYLRGDKKSRHAMEEFGLGRREFIFCPYGEAVYFRKSWHHTRKFFTNPPDFKKEKDIRFRECPAHEMLKNKQYEGEVVVRNVPVAHQKELVGLVKNMGARAERRDILDRILNLKVKGRDVRVITSENQLAQKIANKIGEAFKKKIDIKISHAKEEDTMRIRLDFAS